MKSFKIAILLISLLNTYPAICLENKLSGIGEIQRVSKDNKHLFIFFIRIRVILYHIWKKNLKSQWKIE